MPLRSSKAAGQQQLQPHHQPGEHTEGTLEELDRSFSVALEDAGYTIVGSENEIIEADIYFADPQGRIGGVKFLTTDCADQVVVRLFIDSQS
ncbi:MAG: hypothetical protein M3353_04040 [Actinomycetota bacterium]|nr:hypothetical protein [Actinomycetota bacterium]